MYNKDVPFALHLPPLPFAVTAGEQVEVKRQQLPKMKLVHLKELSAKLGLAVKGNRKLPYVELLEQWIGEETLPDGSAGRRATISGSSSSGSSDSNQQMHVS
jgi:hypothetical protein